MDSINRQHAQRRELDVSDGAMSAQAMPKDLEKHLKAIRKASGRDTPTNDAAFISEIGSV